MATAFAAFPAVASADTPAQFTNSYDGATLVQGESAAFKVTTTDNSGFLACVAPPGATSQYPPGMTASSTSVDTIAGTPTKPGQYDLYMSPASDVCTPGTVQDFHFTVVSGLEATARNTDGSWQQWSSAPLAGLPSNGTTIPEPTQLAAAGMGNGSVQELAQGADGNFYFGIRHSDGTFEGWSAMPGRTGGYPTFGGPSMGIANLSASTYGKATSMVAAVGYDNGIYYDIRQGSSGDVHNDPTASWSGWQNIPTPSFAASKVSIGADSSGAAYLLASDTHGYLYLDTYGFTANSPQPSWSGWHFLNALPGGVGATGDVAVAGTGNAPGAQLVAIDNNHQVWHSLVQVQNGSTNYGQWAQPAQVYGGVAHVAAAGMNNGDAQFVAVGYSDGKLYHDLRYSNGSWSGFATPAGINGAATFKSTGQLAIANLANNNNATNTPAEILANADS